MFGEKAWQIERLEARKRNLWGLIHRTTDVLGIQTCYGDCEAALKAYLDDVEDEQKRKAERDKIEVILRDLLKANVFKQVDNQ